MIYIPAITSANSALLTSRPMNPKRGMTEIAMHISNQRGTYFFNFAA